MRSNPAPRSPDEPGLTLPERRRRLRHYLAWLTRYFNAVAKHKSAYRHTWTPRLRDEIAYAKQNMDEVLARPRTGMEAFRKILQGMEIDLFYNERGRSKAKRELQGQDKDSAEYAKDKTINDLWKNNIDDLRRRWPTVFRTHHKRLRKIAFQRLRARPSQRIYLTWSELSAGGIPAKAIAPWADDPKAMVRGEPNGHAEYGVLDWLGDIGLDRGDPVLENRVVALAERLGRRPSQEQARQINNELAEERRENDDDEQREPIQAWLDASIEHWPDGGLPPGWYLVSDADDVLKRSRRDGLCLADTLAGRAWGRDETLRHIVAQKNGRTVVGLGEDGRVHSHHYCTGKNNEFDAEAYKLFQGTRANPPRYEVTLRRGRRQLRVRV